MRLKGSVAIGVVVCILVYLAHAGETWNGDFWRPWITAHALIQGFSPYQWFTINRPDQFPNLYPASTGVFLIPFLWLPYSVAWGLFSGISAGLLAWALKPERWPVFLSLPLLIALYSGQFVVLQMVAFLMPALAFLWIAKPSTGLLALANPSETAAISFVVGGMLIVAFSLIALPSWPFEWLESLQRNTGHMTSPITRPGGFIAVLALLRWRDPAARLTWVHSLVPQNVAWYDASFLLLVPKTFRQTLFVSISLSIPVIIEVLRKGGADGVIDLYPKGYELAAFGYLPCLIVLWLNRASVPVTSAPALAQE